MFWFIVLLLLAGAGFFFYQKMMTIEREIREEQDTDQVVNETTAVQPVSEEALEEPAKGTDEAAVDSQIVTPEVEDMTTKVEPVADESFSLEDEILAAVNNLPGVKQTELYDSFTDVTKKHLQQVLKEMDDSGKLKREKKGSSYLLYPS